MVVGVVALLVHMLWWYILRPEKVLWPDHSSLFCGERFHFLLPSQGAYLSGLVSHSYGTESAENIPHSMCHSCHCTPGMMSNPLWTFVEFVEELQWVC